MKKTARGITLAELKENEKQVEMNKVAKHVITSNITENEKQIEANLEEIEHNKEMNYILFKNNEYFRRENKTLEFLLKEIRRMEGLDEI